MSMYERLLAEKNKLPADAESPKPKPRKEVNLRAQIEKRDETEAEFKARLKIHNEAPETAVFRTHDQSSVYISRVGCPICKEKASSPCSGDDVPRYGADDIRYVHNARIAAFATCMGLQPEQLEDQPYRSFPNADDYSRWGVFQTLSSGGMKKKPVHHNATFASAQGNLEALTKANEDAEPSKARHFRVYPMVFTARDGYIRADLLAPKES